MPNRNYQNGRSKEYRVMDKLRQEGFQIVARSAGSHSKIDVWGLKFNKSTGELFLRLYQCKPRSMSDAAKDGIAEELKWLAGNAHVDFRVI